MLKTSLYAAALGIITPLAALAQAPAYPTKPIRMIVPFPAGGGVDFMGRIVGQELGKRLGQQIAIDNRAGANGIVGLEALKTSAPDGYTIGAASAGPLAVNPFIYAKLPHDVLRDFTHISMMVNFPLLLVAHPSLPVKNAKELVAFAKAHPGKLDYAAGGYGGNPHLSMVLFLHMSGTSMNYVPYKSGNAGLSEALGGEVPLMMGNILAVLPHVKGGKLRAYGVTSAKRARAAPEIPSLAEAVPGYEALQWFGLLAPAGTPRPIIERLHRETLRVIELPEIQKFFATTGGDPQPSASPNAFGALMRAEIAKWAKVVKQAGIKEQ